MSSSPHPGALQRARIRAESDCLAQADLAEIVLRLLLHQDGSTTRLLEALSGSAIVVHVIEQAFVDGLPAALAGNLPGKRFLRRVTALEAKGRIVLDSLSYTAADALPEQTVEELLRGLRPIGHVLAKAWTRREFRNDNAHMYEELWASVGLPDLEASRQMLIVTPAGPCMLLAETFRRGALDAMSARKARPKS
jgi:chorismate-pyruvate lyase